MENRSKYIKCECCGYTIPQRDIKLFQRNAGIDDALPRLCEDCAELDFSAFELSQKQTFR